MSRFYLFPNFLLRFAAVFLFTVFSLRVFAQISVAANTNPAQLASYITGNGVTITNASYTGANVAAGTFNCTYCSLGLDSGIVLTTGCVSNVPGPNNLPDATCVNDLPGDQDLANLIGDPVGKLHDACVLQFDIVPLTDSLQFKYVFGSEEYPEFACSKYNDVFAFFISGPGIAGLQNIALIPGTNTPVAINTINGGAGFNGACSTVYSQYYVDNGDGYTAPFDEEPYFIQYDGLTTVLTAKVDGLSPCETYHLKLAISDVTDGQYDSGVFIEANSVTSNGVTLGPVKTNKTGVKNAVRGCIDGIFTFQLQNAASQNTVVNFNIGGTAVNGTDYTSISDNVTIAAGSTSAQLTIQPIGTATDTQTVVIYLYSPCINTPYDSATLLIVPGIKIKTEADSTTCGNSNGSATATITAGTSPFIYQWSNGSADSSINDVAAGTYTVTVSNSTGCSLTASAVVGSSVSHFLILATEADSAACGNSNGSALVKVVYGTGPFTYAWSNSGTDSAIQNIAVGTYRVTVTSAIGCSATASATVDSTGGSSGINITSDKTKMCPTDSAQICVSGTYNTYLWNTGSISKCIYAFDAGDYYASATGTGNCSGGASNHIAINVFPSPPVQISAKGDTLISYNAVSYQWFLNGTAIQGATLSTYVATRSGSYSVEVSDTNGCTENSSPYTITGVVTLNGNDWVKVYPNPTTASWQLAVGNDLIGSAVEIYDADGRLVYQSEIRSPLTNIAPEVARGVYILKLTSGSVNYNLKLLKME